MAHAADPERLSPVACPACVATDAGRAAATAEPRDARILLSLPHIHCAACISGTEAVLRAQPGVRAARVNLTRRRAAIEAGAEVTPAALVAALERAGYEAHELDQQALSGTEADRAGRDLLMRLGVAGFATMNVMMLSVSVWSGAEGSTRDLFHWISAAIALPALIFCAQPFYLSAWSALRRGRMNMDVPIVMALVLSAGSSLYETAASGRHAYFDAGLMLMTFLLAGRVLEQRIRAMARSAAETLAALEVPRALRLGPSGEEEVPVAALAVGDLVRVRPGGRLPVDGRVIQGESEVDRALLTGESDPVTVGPGAVLRAGEINLTGPLVVEATAVGQETTLHALAGLVAVAESGRARFSSLTERAARAYAPLVHLAAVLSGLGWYWASGDLRLALGIAVSVLIITCPCALALAAPAVTTAVSGRLFARGLLIKNATALERLAETTQVIFDKTGTLTLGRPEATDFDALPPDVQALAAALAGASSHPLARAVTVAAAEGGVEPAVLDRVREVPGQGVEGWLAGRRVRLGRAAWLGRDTADGQPGMASWVEDAEGHAWRLHFSDALRPGAAQAVADLRAQGVGVTLLSGDRPAAVAALARELGIDDWQAGVAPEAKAAHVAGLAASGTRVLMVGDGLNDTAALALAHASIAPASALEAARAAADMVLIHADLSGVALARRMALLARRRIRQNLGLALAYNLLAVPLAAAGMVTPLIAAAAMSASSLTVSLNALRLRRWTS